MSERMPNAFNPDGHKEYADDLPDWKKEAEMLQAVKTMVVHDLEANEYYPVFLYSEADEQVKKLEYNVSDSAQKVADIIDVQAKT